MRWKSWFVIMFSFNPSPYMFAKIFEDGASYRGQLKTLCRELTREYYAQVMQPEMEAGHNQMHFFETITDGIKDLLHQGKFLRGGFDENVFFPSFYSSSFAHGFKSGKNSKLRKPAHRQGCEELLLQRQRYLSCCLIP